MPGIDECLDEVMALPGARGAAVVEWISGLALGAVGASPNDDHEVTAAETAELARLASEYAAFAHDPASPAAPFSPYADFADDAPLPPGADGDTVRIGTPVEDIIVTTRTGHHLLHFVDTPFDSGVFLHLWLDRADGNLALARLRLRDLAERLALR